MKKGTFITATLTWGAPVEEISKNATDGDPRDCRSDSKGRLLVDFDDTYEYLPLPDLSLELWKGDQLVAVSDSPIDNVEHLHFPVPSDGSAGEYKIVVRLHELDRFNQLESKLSQQQLDALKKSDPDGKLSLYKFGVGSSTAPTHYGIAWWVQSK